VEEKPVRYYEFEEFQLFPLERRLLCGREPVQLTPRVFDTLLTFVENRGELLTKDVLLDKIWRGDSVEEGNLTQNIFLLRRLLGEKPRENKFIVTVPLEGYRFVAKVTAVLEEPADTAEPVKLVAPQNGGGESRNGATASEPKTAVLHETTRPKEEANGGQLPTADQTFLTFWTRHPNAQTAVSPSGVTEVPKTRGFDKRLLFAPLALAVIVLGGFFGYKYFVSARQINSIAVMPFAYDSGNADVEYLSDGMTETLIKSLSGLPGLDVKPRSAVFRYKGKDTDLQTIAKELSVQAILNGRVAQHGDQLTLSLELVDVQKNSVIWSEQYQRKQSDLVSLQSEIAKDVSAKLTAKLSGAEATKVMKPATTDPEAYQAYLKGRYYWNRRTTFDLNKAIEQFKFATDRDPNYALAFVGLADCYQILSEYAGTPSTETLPKSKEYAERALAIDPQLAEAHATLGLMYNHAWQWADSEREFKKAIELNPNYPSSYQWYSSLLRDLGRNDEAAAMIRRASELDPLSSVIGVNVTTVYQFQNNDAAAIENSLKLIELDPNFGAAHADLALSYLRQGRNADAITESEKAVELSNRSGMALGVLGYVYGVTGKRTEAAALIKELEARYTKNEGNGLDIACVYSGLGDKNKVFEWLEKDLEARSGNLPQVRWQITFDSLHNEPRFKDLLKRMNLPE